LLPLLGFLQVLNLSTLGSREITHRCHEYIFSAASPLRRQLPATLTAAVTFLLALALPVTTRVLLSGNIYGAYAILAGALFVASYALASGVLTSGSKLFEVMFTIIVYGILNEVPFCDFIGAINGSQEIGMAHYLLIISFVLVVAGFLGRKRQICCA
jgi:hypothetical protein